MIIIKGTLNAVVLTLDEKKTASCDWLLEFVNETTGESKVLALTDLSAYPSRYNLFEITEGVDVTLSPDQTWKYKAHQMPVIAPKDTDVTHSIKVCEEGICIVIDEAGNQAIEFDTDDEKNTATFDN